MAHASNNAHNELGGRRIGQCGVCAQENAQISFASRLSSSNHHRRRMHDQIDGGGRVWQRGL